MGTETRGVVLVWCEALAAVEASRRVIGEVMQDLPPAARLVMGEKAGRLMVSLDAVVEVVGLLVVAARSAAACNGAGVADGRQE